MDNIRFDKPELDFEQNVFSGAGKDTVRVTVYAWYGNERFGSSKVMYNSDVGSPAWSHIILAMHLEIMEGILKRFPPKDFTIKQRR